jgi:hypothetical protein
MIRCVVLGLLVLPLASFDASGQPPAVSPTAKLKADVTALANERTTSDSYSSERAKLMAELKGLLRELNQKPTTTTPTSPMVAPKMPEELYKGGTGTPVDELRNATNLARANQIDAAYKAFTKIDLQRLAPEDRAFAKYMTASCLRQLGRTTEAIPIYREIANAGEDEFISGNAVRMLKLLTTSEELQVQLSQLRARPKSR